MRLLHYSDIENAHDDPERIGRLAGVISSLNDDDAVVCGTGDNVAPGVLPLVTRGEVALEFFDAVKPDVSTFGNHDFDFGANHTRRIVARSPQEWVSANIYDGRERFAGVSPWTVREIGSERVGFIGVTDPTTPAANPSAKALAFTEPVAAVTAAIDDLNDVGVDHVVVLSHLGRDDERLAGACDVDVILGGHVHSERIERIDGTVLTRPGNGGAVLFEIDLDDGDVTRHVVDDGALDASLTARYRRQRADAELDTVVGHVETPIRRTEREAFRGESRVGNFVADAYRWAAERDVGDVPVVGLQNSGGIRTGPPLSGDVTVFDLVSLVPFDEPLVVVELSGAELLAVFREATDTTRFGEADWWHAHVSGARVVYDYADDELVDASIADGTVAEPSASFSQVRERGQYLVATTEFLLHTADEFPTITEQRRIRTLDVQYEILADYARERGIEAELDGRVVRTGL